MIVTGWLILVGLAVLLSARAGKPLALCPFKRLTGTPCPSCGSTRAVLLLGRGEILSAWLMNPMIATLAAAAVIYLLIRGLSGYAITLHATSAQWRWIALVALAALLANWGYLIVAGI